MDVPCLWGKLYGFVLPFSNNHVKHSGGKRRGVFLTFRQEKWEKELNIEHYTTSWIQLQGWLLQMELSAF